MSDTTNVTSTAVSRRRALQAGVGVAGAAWITPTVLAAPAGAQVSPVCACGANLVVNGGATGFEGDSAVDLNGAFAVPTGWITTNSFRVVQYGAFSVPTVSNFLPSQPDGIGTTLFSGAFRSPTAPSPSTATQTINLGGCAARIAAGTLRYTLSAWLGGFDNQGDAMTLQATFLNSGSNVISSSPALTVTPGDRGNVTRMLFRTTGVAGLPVPPNTASVRIVMSATVVVTPRFNAFADLVDFRLTCT